MKLATLKDGTLDGRLVLVSRDLRHCAPAHPVSPTMRHAIENWEEVESGLARLYEALNAGRGERVMKFDPRQAMAPLPRTRRDTQVGRRARARSGRCERSIPVKRWPPRYAVESVHPLS